MGASLQARADAFFNDDWQFSDDNWAEIEKNQISPIAVAFLMIIGNHATLDSWELNDFDGFDTTDEGRGLLVEAKRRIQANIRNNNTDDGNAQGTNDQADENASLDPDEPTNEENAGISQPRNGFGPGVFFPNPNFDPPCNNDLCQ